jgi:hypothetical protein
MCREYTVDKALFFFFQSKAPFVSISSQTKYVASEAWAKLEQRNRGFPVSP